MTPLPQKDSDRIPWLAPTTLGTLYCGLSAVGYGLMGICQRRLATNCDPVLVNCAQASVSTTFFGAYLLWRGLAGRSLWPSRHDVMALVVIGLVTQLGGVAYQWSIGIVGLAIANPLQMGTMLAGSAVLGFLVLGEKASWRCMIAIVFITVAVVLLSCGAEEGNTAMVAAAKSAEKPLVASVQHGGMAGEIPKAFNRLFWPLLGVVGGVAAGLAFAVMTVGARKMVASASPEATVFFISFAGTVFLGPWSVQRLSLDGIRATPSTHLLGMLAFGALNLVSFFLFIKGLQLITVVRANIINNGLTTALSVLAGLVVFAEPATRQLILGMILLLIGIVMIEYNDGSAPLGELPKVVN